MQTGLKDLESENHFMLEQQLVPFAVLLIPQYKHKLNGSIYNQKQSKNGFPTTVAKPAKSHLLVKRIRKYSLLVGNGSI